MATDRISPTDHAPLTATAAATARMFAGICSRPSCTWKYSGEMVTVTMSLATAYAMAAAAPASRKTYSFHRVARRPLRRRSTMASAARVAPPTATRTASPPSVVQSHLSHALARDPSNRPKLAGCQWRHRFSARPTPVVRAPAPASGC